MRNLTLILTAGALFAGVATADANNGKGGGTPPSATVCTPVVVDPATYTGSCSATNPGGRTCTQEYVAGKPTKYYCTKG